MPWIAYLHNHVKFPVAVYVLKDELDRRVTLIAWNSGDGVGACFARISTWQLNNDDISVEIDGNTMRRTGRAVCVADNGVSLIGARIAIGCVILVHLPPSTKRADYVPSKQNYNHAKPEKYKPVNLSLLFDPSALPVVRRGVVLSLGLELLHWCCWRELRLPAFGYINIPDMKPLVSLFNNFFIRYVIADSVAPCAGWQTRRVCIFRDIIFITIRLEWSLAAELWLPGRDPLPLACEASPLS